MEVVRSRITRAALADVASERYGDMVKAVVDVRLRIMVIGGELHSDEEAMLLEHGSSQQDLWGINLYPLEPGDAWIEFDSMINMRPLQGNRTRGVDDERLRVEIRRVVDELVEPEPPQ